MTSFSTMDVHFAYGLIFILDLFSHGISVPVRFGDYYDNAPNQGYQVSDDITGSFERYPRNVLPNPNFWDQYRWFTRSSIPSRPRKASRRHYHLFHLTSKHPNAVSYHVIQKSHAARKINSRQKVESNLRRSNLYNSNGGSQYQSYPAQPYYQQPMSNYPGYPTGYGSSFPQTQYGVQTGGGVHDSTYDDILQEVSKPMKIGNKIIPPYHNEDRQNDQTRTSIEEAAKQFKLASADMNNMELASLVIYPIPRFNDHPKVHKKKANKKHKKHHDKEAEAKKEKKERKGKTKVTNLVDNLIKNKKEKTINEDTEEKVDKDKNDDQEIKKEKKEKKVKENDNESKEKENEKEVEDNDEDDKMNEKDTTSKDSWAEEEISSKDGQQYTSSKRSEIPHVFNEISNRNGEEKYTASKRSEIPHLFDEISNSDEDDEIEKSQINEDEKSGTGESNDRSEEEDSDENSEENESERKDDETESDNDEVENKSENKKDDSNKTE